MRITVLLAATAATALRSRAPLSPAVRRALGAAACAAALAPPLAAPAAAAARALAPDAPAAARRLVEETYDLLDKYYYDGDALAAPRWRGARDRYSAAAFERPAAAPRFRAEALRALGADRYTRIVDEPTYAAIARFDLLGVGLILAPGADGRAAVASPPLPRGAAAREGSIRQGDVVDTIDGVRTQGKSSFELLEVVDRAPDKARAVLGVAGAAGEGPRLVTLERDVQQARDPVRAVKLGAGSVGYVRLGEFNARTADRLAEVLRDLAQRGAERFVVDLRGNGGGAFQEAGAAAALFLDAGAPVVTVVERSPAGGGADRRETLRAAAPPAGRRAFAAGAAPRVQLWLDGNTASASEIFAGALRDNCAAALAGETSFGKGKIQAVFGLADDSGLIVTVANYLTPAGTVIQGVGLTPEGRLPGPGFRDPPLPSAAEFDGAWDRRVCPGDFPKATAGG